MGHVLVLRAKACNRYNCTWADKITLFLCHTFVPTPTHTMLGCDHGGCASGCDSSALQGSEIDGGLECGFYDASQGSGTDDALNCGSYDAV